MRFDGWSAADREAYEERAAIMEHDGGMRRDVAEVRAYQDVAALRRERAEGRQRELGW